MPAFRTCPVVVEGSACKLFILSFRADLLVAGQWEIDSPGPVWPVVPLTPDHLMVAFVSLDF